MLWQERRVVRSDIANLPWENFTADGISGSGNNNQLFWLPKLNTVAVMLIVILYNR